MKYPRLAAALYTGRWCIHPATFAAMHATFQAAVAGTLPGVKAAEHDSPAMPKPEPPPAPELQVESIKIIPVHGICAKYISQMEADCGGLDLQHVEADLREAASDARVRVIVLHFNSPGGSVTGIPELAALIREINASKPVFAFSDSMCASAAYWLASACTEIVVTPTAEIGSIGVYSALVDESVAWATNGYKLELMKAGTHKAAGIPGLPLAPEDRALIQAEVDAIYGMFTSDVNAGRNGVASEVMQGQTFMGGAAVAVNLADGVVASLTDFVKMLTTMDAPNIGVDAD